MNTPDRPEAPVPPPTPAPPLSADAEKTKAALLEIAAEAGAFKAVASGALADMVADWIIAQYATVAREQLKAATTPMERWNVLRLTARDICALRRGDHSAGRLALEREKFEEEVRETKEERWKQEHPEERVLTMETLEKIERELGLFPEGIKEEMEARNAAREAELKSRYGTQAGTAPGGWGK